MGFPVEKPARICSVVQPVTDIQRPKTADDHGPRCCGVAGHMAKQNQQPWFEAVPLHEYYINKASRVPQHMRTPTFLRLGCSHWESWSADWDLGPLDPTTLGAGGVGPSRPVCESIPLLQPHGTLWRWDSADRDRLFLAACM